MSDNGEASGGPARHANGRFGPGNPGRRAGSRNRISQRLVMSILADFERHRESVLNRLRSEHAAAYARLVARFLPPGDALDEDTDAEPAEARRFAELGSDALSEALATLNQQGRPGQEWRPLSDAEQFLSRELRKARLASDLENALAAPEAPGGRNNGESTVAADRNNGESTVAQADGWVDEPG